MKKDNTTQQEKVSLSMSPNETSFKENKNLPIITQEVRNIVNIPSGAWVGLEGKGLVRVNSTLYNLKYYNLIGSDSTQLRLIQKGLKQLNKTPKPQTPPTKTVKTPHTSKIVNTETPREVPITTTQHTPSIMSLVNQLEEATSNPKSKKCLPDIIRQLKTELKKLPILEETKEEKPITTTPPLTTKTPIVKTVKHTPDIELKQVELIGRLIKKVSSFTTRRETLKTVKEEDKLILLGRQQKKDLSLIEAYLSTLKQDICFSITDKFYVYKGEFASCKRLIPEVV